MPLVTPFAFLVLLQQTNLLQPSPIPEPYSYLNGGSFSGKPINASPDPTQSYRWSNTAPSDGLQIFTLPPKRITTKEPSAFGGFSSFTSHLANTTVQGAGDLRFDFGVEVGAWVEFDSPDLTEDEAKQSVAMSLSEYNEPGVDKTRTPVKHGHTFRLELNDELYDGMRFAWIHVKSVSRPWHITAVRAVCQVKPTNYLGSFNSNDSELNRIWYTAAYTVKAALCKDYFGSILMDRGDRMSWTGDAHPAQAAALVAFGNYPFIKKNLENTAHQDNGIRSYALYWVLSLLDYYQYTGDSATLDSFIANAEQKLETAHKDFQKDSNLGFYGWDERLCAGFELWFRKRPEAQRCYEFLSLQAWQRFSEAMQTIGHTELARKYGDYARSGLRQLQSTPDWFERLDLHSAVEAINTGLIPNPLQDNLFVSFLSDRVQRLSLSPFNEFFVLQALAKSNRYQEALETAHDLWGGMIAYGGTTTFEVYRPSWDSQISQNGAVPNSQCGIVSLCHPWGAGVAKWLSEEILGIRATSPGFKTYHLQPHFGATVSRVEGSCPTPKGVIRFSYDSRLANGACTSPAGTTGTLFLPLQGRQVMSFSLDGQEVWRVGRPRKGDIRIKTSADSLVFGPVRPGTHKFSCRFASGVFKMRSLNHFPPLNYQMQAPNRDLLTHGNWIGRYGKEGSLLCSYLPNGADQLRLPEYVKSVDFYRAFPKSGRPDSTLWEKNTLDRRALQSGIDPAGPRSASAVTNTDQTMTATITLKRPRKFRLALYFLDWVKAGQRSAVEIFDASNMHLLAPVEVVTGQDNGVYLIYECDRSIKLRFDKVRGQLLTLSGLFFDASAALNEVHMP
jgi:hypothetical protein